MADQWEYRVVNTMTPMKDKDMNALGVQGWELVEVVNLALGSIWYYFKRRKP